MSAFARHKNIATTMIYDDNRKDQAGKVAGLLADGTRIREESLDVH